jgi:hypothetical protein
MKLEIRNVLKKEKKKKKEIRRARFYVLFGYVDSIRKLIFIFARVNHSMFSILKMF